MSKEIKKEVTATEKEAACKQLTEAIFGEATNNSNIEKENKDMEKTMEIKGMMCGHCEARVKKALEALPEVTEAIVSHEAGTAVVKLSAAVSDDVLKKAVEDQDYEVTDIR